MVPICWWFGEEGNKGPLDHVICYKEDGDHSWDEATTIANSHLTGMSSAHKLWLLEAN